MSTATNTAPMATIMDKPEKTELVLVKEQDLDEFVDRALPGTTQEEERQRKVLSTAYQAGLAAGAAAYDSVMAGNRLDTKGAA